ncbi:hypothetical protein ABH920_000630 [Catenulispora sp. EB89]|uniref:hypothetical protein n=1 Tax=Catenulispora sp. EB89 TaxID=3156257 RepID=UPI003511CAB1
MRKLATLAVLTLSAGTVLAGGATSANAAINLGNPVPDDTTTAPAPVSTDFANNWCGAPWQWTTGQACDNHQAPTAESGTPAQ